MHLSENEIAIAAEHLAENKLNKLDSEIKNHIAECDQCAQEVQVTAELFEEEELQANTHKKRNTIVTTIISLAAILIVFVCGYQFLNRMEDAKPEKTLQVLSLNKSENPDCHILENKQLLAYATHSNLEKLVERSKVSVTRGRHTEVTVPSILNSSDLTPTLTWNNTSHDSLFIEVLDNNGQVIIEKETISNECKLELKTPGLYYWKLLNDEFDLIFCGKIIIK